MSEHFGVDLGGSLLDRERFSEISDIDIAVEGLTGPEEFFAALGIAIEGTGLPVDVVELEKVPSDVAERILARFERFMSALEDP